MTKEINVVRAWASDARNAQYGFFKAVVWAIEQFQNKNNTPLVLLDCLVKGKNVKEVNGERVKFEVVEGERLEFAKAYGLIWDQTIRHTKLTVKDGKVKFVVTVPEGDNVGAVVPEKLEALRMLSAQKVTIKNDAFKSAFPKAVKPKAVKPQAEAIADIIKAIEKRAQEAGIPMWAIREAMPGKIEQINNEPAH